MRNAPTNQDDVIDSRDVIERIEELREERDSFTMLREDGTEEEDPEGWADQNKEDAEELAALEALAEECEGYSDWEHGEALIRESYWIEYVEEMLKVCGDLPQSIPWYIAIDWDETTQNIAQDYSIVTFDGVDYYIRNC